MDKTEIWPTIFFLRDEVLSDPTLGGLEPPLREAHAFRYVLERLPIGISPTETLAGDFGWEWGDPETLSELERRMDRRTQRRGPAGSPAPLGPAELLAQRFHCFGGYTLAHTCVDYPRIVDEGIGGLVADIRSEMKVADSERRTYLAAMEIALLAVVAWAHRYADAAEALAAREADTETRARLGRIAAACRHVPLHPARSFHEGVQAVWLVHAAVGLSELSAASLSLGRIDQYLYPAFRADLDRGIPRSELERSLADLHRKLNRFGDPACAVNLGGVDEQGRDLFNPLSALIVHVSRTLHLPAPILAARVHPGLPSETFDLLVDPELFAMGQPTFYGEFSCRQALLRRGVAPGDVHRWAANSCMGLVIPGEEISDMWGAVVNVLLPLELAINGGKPIHHDLPIAVKSPARTGYNDFDELFEAVLGYLDELLEFCVRQNQESTRRIGMDSPNPFLSALIRDGIRRGKDRAEGGPRYYTVIVEAFGLINAADALQAIKTLVFEQGRYTLAELIEAARGNFESAPALRTAIRQIPKYGNDDPAADAMARRLADEFARRVSHYSTPAIRYAPSFHTLNAHIGAGTKLGASLDGRLAGQPLAKNIGPIPGHAREGHTALIRSATTIDQSAFHGGQALDISIGPDLMGNEAGRKAFQALLQTYFRLGGLQVQVNGVDAGVLRQAMAEPEHHEDVIVRIAGYSARFVTLDRTVQEEMVERFARGL